MAELFKVNAPVRKPLFEGVQGENEARSIQFDITPWVEELGDGAVTATAKRSQDSQPYPVTVTKDGTTVTWKPTSTDTAFAGVGSFQLEYTVDDVLAKTCIWSTMVAPSLDPAGDPPDPYDNWLAEMRQIAADALQDAQDADASADAAASSATNAEANAQSFAISLNSYANGNVYIPASDFVNGGLKSDGTINAGQVYYASTSEDHSFDYPTRLSVKNGYKYNLFFKTGEATYTNTGYLTFDYFMPANKIFKIQIARVTETWGAADLEVFSKQIEIISKDRAVSTFNSAQIEQLKNGDEFLDAVFNRGGVTQGVYYNYVGYRIATPDIVRFDKDIVITADENFRFGVHTFDSDDNFTADLGWFTNRTFPAGEGFRIIVARSAATENTSEIANVFDFYTKIHTKTPFKERIESMVGGVLDMPIMSGSRPKMVAHTGYCANAPENSLPSFIAAGKAGFWGIESDLQQTSDGHYVMCHDVTVDRTTDGTGSIPDMTLAEVRALHMKNYPNVQIPTFEEYLATCKRYGCVPMIEIKAGVPNNPQSFARMFEVVKNFGLDKKCIISGSKWALANFKAALPDVPFCAIYQNGTGAVWETELAFVSAYSNTGIWWDYLLGATLERATEAHSKGMLFGTFTVDNADNVFDAFENGVDFVTTNSVLPND